jgi:hypothetical protein
MSYKTFVHLEQGQNPDNPLTLRWTGRSRTYVSSSVCIGDLLILADFGSNIIAFERHSGEKVWTAKAEGAIAENLFVFGDMVWALDVKGNLKGYDLQGQCQAQHRLAYGGWGLRHDGNHVYFVNRAQRPVRGRNGIASKMDLETGEIEVFAEGVLSDANGYKNNTWIFPDEGAVVFFIAPDLTKFSVHDGTVIQKWPISNCISLSGLAFFRDRWVAITELDTGWKTSLGGDQYLEYNSTPVIFGMGDRLEGFPVVARGVLDYANRVVQLDDDRFLIEAAEWLFVCDRGTLRSIGPLPERSFWGNQSAGLFAVKDTLIVFQVGYFQAKYFLHVYEVVSSSWQVECLGPPMLTHPQGRNFLGAAVDQYGNDFFLRGDGRFHYLTWDSDKG